MGHGIDAADEHVDGDDRKLGAVAAESEEYPADSLLLGVIRLCREHEREGFGARVDRGVDGAADAHHAWQEGRPTKPFRARHEDAGLRVVLALRREQRARVALPVLVLDPLREVADRRINRARVGGGGRRGSGISVAGVAAGAPPGPDDERRESNSHHDRGHDPEGLRFELHYLLERATGLEGSLSGVIDMGSLHVLACESRPFRHWYRGRSGVPRSATR